MPATVETPDVRIGRQEGLQAFEIHVDDSGDPAGFTQFLDYDHRGTDQRIFPHTSVKEEYNGNGLASILVRSALDESIAAGYRIIPICPYVKAWIQRHSDYAQHADTVSTDHLAALQTALAR